MGDLRPSLGGLIVRDPTKGGLIVRDTVYLGPGYRELVILETGKGRSPGMTKSRSTKRFSYCTFVIIFEVNVHPLL